jgi:hypothetical protein
MPREIAISLSPQQAHNFENVRISAAKYLGIKENQLGNVLITRKSIDARRGNIKVNIGLKVYDLNESIIDSLPQFKYKDVRKSPEVIVVGSGPAGLFASLRLIELGIKPIILERGKDVSSRKRDVAILNRNKGFDPESNFAFGEGGAGTFSDGKLYSRSRKRGDTNRILKILHLHGAQEQILYEAHPHIGTNVLPRVISSVRKTIEEHGGEVIFNAKVNGIKIIDGGSKGVLLADGRSIAGKAVIIATGHSARDIYYSLHHQGIKLEAKPFAMGVRVEHPQELIDTIQYHGKSRGEFLPAATYSLAQQVDGRGVYSFCMCPGGYIVPAISGFNELVVNGMSPSKRNSQWANSGIVVEMQLCDLKSYSKHEILAGLEYQKDLEELAFKQVRSGVTAPAQRLTDFVNKKFSSNLPNCSYQPGVISSRLEQWMPMEIVNRLQAGFSAFDKKMKGFLTNEALVIGVESRTSSPLRIPRNSETFQHVSVNGLFPCGEGAGYAGGIVSSAIDGERCAEAISQWIKSNP